MKYSTTSDLSVQEVVERIKNNAQMKDFGVSNVTDMHNSLAEKGVFFTRECKVMDLSNPHNALNLLSTNADMSMILPCKITISEELDGTTSISIFKDIQGYRRFTHDLDDIASKTEQEMIDIVEMSA